MVVRIKDRMTIAELVSDVEGGSIRIPQFQRGVVWSLKEAADLIDSIIMAIHLGF